MNPSLEIGAIVSVAVHVKPSSLIDVVGQINMLYGVEVHQSSPDGKIIVTIEELPGEKLMVERLTQIHAITGVISATLIYTHQE